jgi:uncharacterized protein YdaT
MNIFHYLNLRTEWESITGTDGTISNLESFLNGSYKRRMSKANRQKAIDLANVIIKS